jgi:hypothetical protein
MQNKKESLENVLKRPLALVWRHLPGGAMLQSSLTPPA